MQKQTQNDKKTATKKTAGKQNAGQRESKTETQSSEFENRETIRQPRIDSGSGSGSRPKTEVPASASGESVEGEGSYTASRRYDEDAQNFANSGKVEPAAEEARRAVEQHGDEMKKAELEGRRGPKH